MKTGRPTKEKLHKDTIVDPLHYGNGACFMLLRRIYPENDALRHKLAGGPSTNRARMIRESLRETIIESHQAADLKPFLRFWKAPSGKLRSHMVPWRVTQMKYMTEEEKKRI
jgi:hypothetical protein